MTFRVLKNEIRDIVLVATKNIGYNEQDFDVLDPPRKEFGDLSCNIAFRVSKKLKKHPFEIANEIVNKQLTQLLDYKRKSSKGSLVSSVEAHPTGYINFKADLSKLASITLNNALQCPDYGFCNIGNNSLVIIEHTSINPNKALHVGHMRNVILGDSLYRIMKAANYKVMVVNYIDDSGLQVADIIVGFKFLGLPLEPKNPLMKFDEYCGDHIYLKVNELYKKDTNLQEKRRLVLKEIESPKSDIAKFAFNIALRVVKAQLKTCWRLKSRYDLLNFESQIVGSNLWSTIFDSLKSKGIATLETEGKNKGCWIIKLNFQDYKILVRSDGTPTYIAKDIPYAAWKLGTIADPFYYHKFAKQWDSSLVWATTLDPGSNDEHYNRHTNPADRVITIIDSRQKRLQMIISEILSYLDVNNYNKYYHLAYEAVTLSSDTAQILGINIGNKQFMHMSGRKGIYVNADYVLNKLHAKAYDEAKSRNPNLPDQTLDVIAESIAVSAIRYAMIKQDIDKIITFDIIESLSLAGDTGPYLQYAYARSVRILEKSKNNFGKKGYDLMRLDEEISIIKEIAKFDLVLEEAARTLSPKLLARYAYKLAVAFNIFYEKVPVIHEFTDELRVARLALVKAFAVTLKVVLDLLGIQPLDRM
jgi:arginyl-tRNA synthetase